MTQYLITKRDECLVCGGVGYYADYTNEGGNVDCTLCNTTGYFETQIDLLTALTEARLTEVLCDCNLCHWGTVSDDGVMLEWVCPKDGKKHRGANV